MGKLLVDVHAHLDYPELLGRIESVIDRAEKAGVKAIIANGLELKSNKVVLELAQRFEIVRPAIGLYPVDALVKEIPEIGEIKIEKEFEFLEKHKKNIVAFGEIGLDFVSSTEEERELQKKVFKKILAISKEADVPVIVHSRKAEKEAIEVMESMHMKKVVLHCFSGRKSLIKRAAENGWFFSVPPNIVRATHFQSLVALVSINQLLTETDAPFLSPYKDKINEPAYVAEAVKKISEIKELNIDEVENIIFKNYMRLF